MADSGEITVGLFHDVCLCDYRNIVLTLSAGKFKSRTRYSACSEVGCDLEIHRKFAGNFNTAAAENIFTLCVFTVECPINTLFRN